MAPKTQLSPQAQPTRRYGVMARIVEPLPVPPHAYVRLEMALEGSAFASPQFSDAFGGSEWADVTTECRAVAPIVLEYGIFSDDPTELVAGASTLSFALNNASSNAAGILGWYSPLNAVKRGGFDFNIPVRLVIGDGTTTSYKFYGHLADILPTPGVHGEKLVYCTAVDLMDDYARMPAPAIPTQFDKDGAELIQMILDGLPTNVQPLYRSIETGLETYPFALDKMSEDEQTVREAIYDICASEMRTAGFVGTTATGGGLFLSQNRHAQITDPTVLHHFELEILRDGLEVPGSRDDLVSTVQVTTHPTKTSATPVVLFSLETASAVIYPNQVNNSILGPYRDPDNPSDRIGGMDMIQPVANIDYTMNSMPDGAGIDLTAQFGVYADYSSGTGVRFEIINNSPLIGYVTKMEARGTAVYRRTAVVEEDVPNISYGNNVKSIDMPYQSDINKGQDAAAYIASVFSRSLERVESLSFYANRSADLLAKTIVAEPGMRVSVSEAVTGLDNVEFIINGVRLEIKQAFNGLGIWPTWFLKPADMGRYWRLGVAGSSELGATTVLGY